MTLEHYETVLGASSVNSMGESLLNSLAISIPATIIPIAIAAFAAYGFAWIDFKGRKWMFIATVSLMAIPLQVALIPLLRMYVGGATLHLALPGQDANPGAGVGYQRYSDRCLADPHRVCHAVRHLLVAQLHRKPAS